MGEEDVRMSRALASRGAWLRETHRAEQERHVRVLHDVHAPIFLAAMVREVHGSPWPYILGSETSEEAGCRPEATYGNTTSCSCTSGLDKIVCPKEIGSQITLGRLEIRTTRQCASQTGKGRKADRGEVR